MCPHQKKCRQPPASGNPRRAAGFSFTGQSGLLRRLFAYPPRVCGACPHGFPLWQAPGAPNGPFGANACPLRLRVFLFSSPFGASRFCPLTASPVPQGKRTAGLTGAPAIYRAPQKNRANGLPQSNPQKKRGGGLAKTPSTTTQRNRRRVPGGGSLISSSDETLSSLCRNFLRTHLLRTVVFRFAKRIRDST